MPVTHPTHRFFSPFILLFITLSFLGNIFFPAPVQAKPQRPSFFDSKTYQTEAYRFSLKLKADAKSSKFPVHILLRKATLAQSEGRLADARRYYALAAGKTKSTSSLLRLAFILLTEKRNTYYQRQTAKKEAILAALLAFRRARDEVEEANALDFLGVALENEGLYQYAIEVNRAVLHREKNESVSKRLNNLLRNHGFRITSHNVDSDAASPRACIVFSEKLPVSLNDLEKYISVEASAQTALTKENNQVCIEGIRHGEKLQVKVRKDLQNIYGESLYKAATLDLYVKDRTPTLRFTGKNYVLPATGQQGVPVVSVNLEKAEFTLYRIGDRALANTLHKPQYNEKLFGKQLNGEEVEQLANDYGRKVWQGTLDIQSQLNRDVTTSLPIGKVLTTPEPGIYVLMGHIPDKDLNRWSIRPTQWFIISDLGLTAFSGQDGLNAFVRNLSNAHPMENVEIKLVARNNEILATGKTDAQGHIHFAAGLIRGEGGQKPAMLMASKDQRDHAFLDLSANGFDLSDRGVSGRKAPGPLDAYLYSERGVYKAGEKVHLSALLRNDKNEAAPHLPVTLVVDRPDGVEYKRITLKDQGLGGRSWTLPLLESVQTGTWKARLYTNPKEEALAEISFLVEDFVPERLKLSLKPVTKFADPQGEVKINLEGAYLFGAPASGLALEGTVTVARRTTDIPGFEGYRFGREGDNPRAVRETLSSLPKADQDGKAALAIALPDLPDTTRPLEARITVRMVEPSGRAIERMTKLPILPTRNAIGIRPLFSGSVPNGEAAQFMVTMMNKKGQPASANGLKWELKKIEKRYQWYTRNGNWRYEPIIKTKRIANGVLQGDDTAPIRLSHNVDWGQYRLEITSPTNEDVFASYGFEAGWYTADSTEDTPDILEVGLEKASYNVGDTAILKLKPRSDGLVLVTAMNERLLWSTSVAVKKGDTRIEIPVGANWGAGAYIMATHYRPMHIKTRRMPGRAMGIQWLALNKESHTLKVKADMPDAIRPETRLTIPVALEGLKTGEKAYIMAALVDEGILNLTRYKAPAPDKWFNGKRQLGIEIRDLYGKLIDGMQARAGRIRSGGDGAIAGMSMKGAPPVQKPVSLFSGIIAVDKDGKALLEFDVPSFTGSLKLMTVAWSKTRTGHGIGKSLVRDPVVMLGTVPRFLSLGDLSRFHVDLQNVEGKAGQYTLTVNGNMQVAAGRENTFSTSFMLDEKGQKSLQVPLHAKAVGDGIVTASLSGPDGFSIAKSYQFTVRPSYPSITRQIMSEIRPGGFLTVSDDLLTNIIPGTGSVTLSVAPQALPDIPGLLTSLDRYPYGCSEQITSRALPLLYLSSVAEQVGLTQKRDKDLKVRLQNAIDKLTSRQGSEGDFGLWQPGGGGLWLTSYVMDFLGRAKTEGYTVPSQSFESGLRYLKNALSYNSDLNKGGRNLAYGLYILSKNRKARVGDLRYYADEKLASFTTPLARTHLAAALAMYGDSARASTVFASALDMLKGRTPTKPFAYGTYGSDLRDSAALLTLASESGTSMETLPGISSLMQTLQAENNRTTTQEQAWLLMAANALLSETKHFSLSINGLASTEPLHARLGEESVLGIDTRIENTGESPARVSITIAGSPTVPEPPASKGFDIERLYFTLDGKAVSPAHVRQNTRLVTLIRVHEHERKAGELIVADYLPAGFEIDNPRLVASGSSARLSWLPRSATRPVHSEFRDHRFTAAFSRSSRGKPETLTMAYIIRAVAPGTYTHPPAIVEDMYRPERTARTGVGRVIVK